MILGDVFERFSQDALLSVMAQGIMENALNPQFLDQVFEDFAERQFTNKLLFSTIVDLMTPFSRNRSTLNCQLCLYLFYPDYQRVLNLNLLLFECTQPPPAPGKPVLVSPDAAEASDANDGRLHRPPASR